MKNSRTISLFVNFWKLVKKLDNDRLNKQTPTPGVASQTDLPYLPDGHRHHTLSLFWPENTGPAEKLPVLVDIHGGGWMYGDKELNRHPCAFWASKGFLVVDISYRLQPEVTLKEQIQDIFAAFRWVDEHAGEHGGDMQHVFITGDSAGGHLTGLSTCVRFSQTLQGIFGVEAPAWKPSAIAITHGVTDYNLRGFLKGPFDGVNAAVEAMLYRPSPSADPNHPDLSACPWYGHAALWDTLEDVRKDNGSLDCFPPTLLLSSDGCMFREVAKKDADYLPKQGLQTEFLFFKGEDYPVDGKVKSLGHVFNISYPTDPAGAAANTAMTEFFKKYL